ncbi:vitamin B6 photo-protection and homoeostasis-domain-containing protein [Paraphysoderma sedebokerense]|nr:vitamin B6 photo-protection and homoeostasis-domain-containing protein [Paraphysoderma sedebokerense]
MFCQIHSSIHCSRFSSKLFISRLYTSGLKLKVVPSSFRSFSSEPTRLPPNPFSIEVTQSSHKWWIPRSPRHVITISQTTPNEVSVETRLEQRNPNGTTESTSRQKGLFRTVYDRVLATFLPAGYPHSVSPEYTSYCQWSFLNSVAGSVTGVLSTQSLLFAIGLGAGSIPLAAALNWIIKDGLGQFGGVLYASLTGSRFDSEPKKIRFNAALAMQFATVIELLTPLYPAGFLAMASISNIGKNIAWLASSATRAQMHQTFALKDNLGDITAKSGSQATAASLFGTGIGILGKAHISLI